MTATDANGKSTSYTYDVMGRVQTVTDPLGNITTYNYDLSGKISQVTDAKGHTIQYEYDSRNRVTKMTDQLGHFDTYTYNTSDNLTSLTDRKGQTTSYTYDLMNRMTRIDYSDGTSTSYTYDTNGKVLTITDSNSGTISYTYTGTGCSGGCNSMPDKIASEETSLGRIAYTYDALGRRTSMTVSGLSAVNYSYDAGGRLNNVQAMINGTIQDFAIGYDTLGLRISIILPNGITSNYSYDAASHLQTLQYVNSTQQVLDSVTYIYDASGNRIAMTRPSVNLPLPNEVSTASYNNANQMMTFDEKNITHDANGNMASVTNNCGTTIYTWDVRNRLVGIQGFNPDCSSLSTSFAYDALGRRITKTINGQIVQYLYDGLDIVRDFENGLPSATYIRTLNIDEPLARARTDNSVRYYLLDALGSVVDLTDENGNIKTAYSYEPFGKVVISGEASDNPFQYTGRENDGTGFYYYRARYYSPELHRMVSEDPIGFKGGDVNFFAYVGNNPINHVDPEGLQARIPPGGGGPLPPPSNPPSRRPPGYPPAFGDLVPGDKCLNCDWFAVLLCILRQNPPSVVACSLCAEAPSWYNPACVVCAGWHSVRLPDCLRSNCQEGTYK